VALLFYDFQFIPFPQACKISAALCVKLLCAGAKYQTVTSQAVTTREAEEIGIVCS
jgi:hypothetical protein